MDILSLKTSTIVILLVNFLFAKNYLVEMEDEGGRRRKMTGGERQEDRTVVEDVKASSVDNGGSDYRIRFRRYWRKK